LNSSNSATLENLTRKHIATYRDATMSGESELMDG